MSSKRKSESFEETSKKKIEISPSTPEVPSHVFTPIPTLFLEIPDTKKSDLFIIE